jgi:hypothetical protein
VSTAEQPPINIVSRPASMHGEPVVCSAQPAPTRPDLTHVDLSRNSGNTLRIGALIITAAMGAAFAFAVGLKVHTVVASALAVTVLSVVIWQDKKR